MALDQDVFSEEPQAAKTTHSIRHVISIKL